MSEGGDMGLGRIQEIADNRYGDEEKQDLARRVLVATEILEGGERQALSRAIGVLRAGQPAEPTNDNDEGSLMSTERDIALHKLANAAAARASVNACQRMMTALEQELRAAGVKDPKVVDAMSLIRSAISSRDDTADQQFYDQLAVLGEGRGVYAGTQR
ncbi:hypothetical protein MWH03_00330 [Klebsiella pneumoniae]|nr:hypothetical protein [Klebsiella pneumoniae]